MREREREGGGLMSRFFFDLDLVIFGVGCVDTSLDKRELSTGHVGFFDVRREFKSKTRYFFLSFFFLWFLYFEEIIMSCFLFLSNLE